MNKRYFEKLNTEKLAEFNKHNELQKVEFSLIGDIEKRSQAVIKDTNRFLEFQREYFDALKRATNLSNSLTDTLKAQEKQLEEATQAFKDLGLDAKQLFKYEKQLEEVSNEIKEFENKTK